MIMLNMTLNQVVEAFMADQGIESSKLPFHNKNTKDKMRQMSQEQKMVGGLFLFGCRGQRWNKHHQGKYLLV